MTSAAMKIWLERRDKDRESARLKIATNTRPEQRERILDKHYSTDYRKCVGVKKLGAKSAVPVVIDSTFMVSTELGCLSIEEAYGEVEVLSPDEIDRRCQEVQSEWTEVIRESRHYLNAVAWTIPGADDTFQGKPKKKLSSS